MTSVKALESSFLSFIQSYKNLFNTIHARLEENQDPNSEEAMLEKRMLIDSFYQSFQGVINSIDSLEEINTEVETENGKLDKKEDSEYIVPPQLGSHSSGQNIGGLNYVESKYDKYEREICEEHDKAVHRYKKAILTADVWKQKLYTFINENLPSGNH